MEADEQISSIFFLRSSSETGTIFGTGFGFGAVGLEILAFFAGDCALGLVGAAFRLGAVLLFPDGDLRKGTSPLLMTSS